MCDVRQESKSNFRKDNISPILKIVKDRLTPEVLSKIIGFTWRYQNFGLPLFDWKLTPESFLNDKRCASWCYELARYSAGEDVDIDRSLLQLIIIAKTETNCNDRRYLIAYSKMFD